MTDDFLADITLAADKRRIVLMLDTFGQMTALDDWAHDVAQRLPANVLLVIVGRALPNWNRAWQSWMATAQVEELKPMTEDDMRDLVRRYYATMRGGEPSPTQVDAIIRFARGLPTGVNDIGTLRPDTISAIPEGTPLLEAERLAREREPRDGSPQKSVVDQISE